MHDTAERVRRVQLRAGELHRKRERRLLGGLASLCVLLAFSLVGTVGIMTGGGRGCTVLGSYGAILLHDDAGGYVLASVLAFTVGVVVTALCIRHRKKEKEKSKEEEQ
jgi:hypothetical protein